MSKTIKIRAAHALSKAQFCIALTNLDAEDMFSIILTYDANVPEQPWSRDEVPRNITSMAASEVTGTLRYAAMSNEGDVFYIDDEDAFIHEKIEGAGLYTEDARGLGATKSIANIGETLYVAGLNQQLYKRDMGTWKKLEPEIFYSNSNYESVDFLDISGFGENDIYIVGTAEPKQSEAPDDLEEAMKKAVKENDFATYAKLEAQKDRITGSDVGVCFSLASGEWEEIDTDDGHPNSVLANSESEIWMGDVDGNLLVLDEDNEFDNIEIVEDGGESIYSITYYNNKLILACDRSLHAYDENFDSLEDEVVRIKPKLNKKIHSKPSPLKVQAVDDVMFYFDYNLGVYIWDGEKTWTNIPIPPELLEREFKGLK